ncbi:hypothetical protein Q1695_006660 [Nippostrongylus brasiliensis]|nr:hypothetical protein Q1695_006660 [Nippostrongylus brasiliensis]
MKLMSVIVLFISVIVSISALAPTRAKRSFSEALADRNSMPYVEYDNLQEALPPRRVRFYRTGGTILLG